MFNKKKIDNKSKFDSMVGFIENGTVSAVEPGWRIKPEALAKLLMDRFPTKEDAIKLELCDIGSCVQKRGLRRCVWIR